MEASLKFDGILKCSTFSHLKIAALVLVVTAMIRKGTEECSALELGDNRASLLNFSQIIKFQSFK